jgi:hypothetical protein
VNLRAKNTTRRESILSSLILLILVLIASAIVFQQYRFNPAVFVYLEGQAQTDAAADSPATSKTAALIELPPGVSPMSPPEAFTAETLSDKIDGKAELYLSAGFKKLQTQRYRISERPALWMEIYIFDMGGPENAFAVYSNQQRRDAAPAGLGSLSYQTENALYWVHGPYYLEFIASDASPRALQAMMTIGESFNRSHAVESRTVSGTTLFPQTGLLPDSINLIAADAFGYAGFDRVYTADYRLEGSVMTAFISRRPSPAAAEALAADYRDFLIRFGGQSAPFPAETRLRNAEMIEILGSYEVVFTRGPYLGGVHEAQDGLRALRLAETLDQKLQRDIGEETD